MRNKDRNPLMYRIGACLGHGVRGQGPLAVFLYGLIMLTVMMLSLLVAPFCALVWSFDQVRRFVADDPNEQ